MQADEAAIETEELTKRYGEVVAVRGLEMTVKRGTVYGFLGPNRAGKTTMRMLTTLTKPTTGAARVAGFDVAERGRVTEQVSCRPAELKDRIERTSAVDLETVFLELSAAPTATTWIDRSHSRNCSPSTASGCSNASSAG